MAPMHLIVSNKPPVKITAPSQKPLPLLATVKPKTFGAKTKPLFSDNLALYMKGSNGHGGKAGTVSNSRAVSRRT